MTSLKGRIRESAGIPGPVGVFDSGYGGLTILREIRRALPQADFIYLGDNARAPYGNRSFDLVYNFTLQAVEYLFAQGCQLVILACNTASAKALRSIQQRDLPLLDPDRRVLGVIRPTAEAVASYTRNGHIGLFGTPGTVASRSYDMELAKLHPDLVLSSLPCPMWVPLVENMEADGEGADFFVKREIDRLLHIDPQIDAVILGCTHYPLLLNKIRKYMPREVTVLSQGDIVAASLLDYLARHPEMEKRITKGASVRYLTTEEPDKFSSLASVFMKDPVQAERVTIDNITS
ncbi:MAG: glutamate racemase [Muribaculaceae bacterium]|nr:glutamate racemase [Muribaculaceae bacterium]